MVEPFDGVALCACERRARGALDHGDAGDRRRAAQDCQAGAMAKIDNLEKAKGGMMMWIPEIERKLTIGGLSVATGLAIVIWARLNPDGDPWAPGAVLGLVLLAADEIRARRANARNAASVPAAPIGPKSAQSETDTSDKTVK